MPGILVWLPGVGSRRRLGLGPGGRGAADGQPAKGARVIHDRHRNRQPGPADFRPSIPVVAPPVAAPAERAAAKPPAAVLIFRRQSDSI